MRRIERARIIIISAVAFALSCAVGSPWSQRKEFYGEVRCDLAVDSVQRLAGHFGGTGWTCYTPSERMTNCSFMAGRTRVTVEFQDGQMRSIEDGDEFGVTGMATRPKLDICSGGRSRHIMIVPHDDSWIGGAITANGKSVGTVTAGHAQGVYVPLGRYVLQFEKAGLAPLKIEIAVPDGTLREPPRVVLP